MLGTTPPARQLLPNPGRDTDSRPRSAPTAPSHHRRSPPRLQGADALDAVRRLHDLSGCGGVLSVTDLDGSKFTCSPHTGQLDQLKRRGLSELLPDTPTGKDVTLIWQVFQLPDPTPEIEHTIHALARKNSFGILLTIVHLAGAEVRLNGTTVDLQHFSAALRRMGRGLA